MFRRMLVVGVLCASSAWVAFSIRAEDSAGWEKAKDDGRIVVYTREASDSDVKEFKASMVVRARLSSVVKAIADVSSYSEWYTNVVEARVLESQGEQEFIYYLDFDMPFPLKNRDGINHVIVSQDPETKVVRVEIKGLNDYQPAVPKKVRFPVARGGWVLTPLKPDRIRVDHYYLADPGGAVPAWMVNLLIVKGPYETFMNLKSFVQNPAYRDAELDWIQDD